jgi:putative FmdB family regulatory protein
MPLYEYQCRNCGLKFDAWNKVSERATAKCTRCGELAKKRMSAVTAVFGWRLTENSHEVGHKDEFERDV